jgi:hypothetical protein
MQTSCDARAGVDPRGPSKATSLRPDMLARAGNETLMLIEPLELAPIDPCVAASAPLADNSERRPIACQPLRKLPRLPMSGYPNSPSYACDTKYLLRSQRRTALI